MFTIEVNKNRIESKISKNPSKHTETKTEFSFRIICPNYSLMISSTETGGYLQVTFP